MTDDLNRLRAGELTDDERRDLDTWAREGVYHCPCRMRCMCDDEDKVYLFTAVESIVAARTAALIDRAECAETERDRLEADWGNAGHDLAALRAAVEALADEWADQPDDWDEDTQQQIADGKRLRSLLAAAPTETEGGPCHCGQPVVYGYDGNPAHTRGLCEHCDLVRCDAYPGECIAYVAWPLVQGFRRAWREPRDERRWT